jgi:methyl-accepting chemotaxis protein
MKDKFIRRKRSLLDREIQMGLAGIILGYLLLYTAFLVMLLGVPIWFIYQYAPGPDSDRMEAIGRFIVDDQKFWLLIAIFLVAVSIHSIFVTRKFAGPIFVFRRHLRRAQNGELSRIYLRKKDGFQDMKDLLNDHFDQISDTMARIRSGLDSIEEWVNRIEPQNSQSEASGEPNGAFADMREEIEKLKTISRKTWNYTP